MTTVTIQIFRDGAWAGTGTINQYGEIVCGAVLGRTQDESDECYEAIQDEIDAEPQDEGRYSGEGSIHRPDGEYSWRIKE